MSGCHFHLLWLSSASGHQGEMISLPVRITPWLYAEICSAGGAGSHRKEFWHITAELMWVGGWGVSGFVSLESIRFLIWLVCYSCSHRQCQGRMTLGTAMLHLQSPGLLLPIWFCNSIYQISEQILILVLCERIFSTGFMADSFYQPYLMEWHKQHPTSKNILGVMSHIYTLFGGHVKQQNLNFMMENSRLLSLIPRLSNIDALGWLQWSEVHPKHLGIWTQQQPSFSSNHVAHIIIVRSPSSSK